MRKILVLKQERHQILRLPPGAVSRAEYAWLKIYDDSTKWMCSDFAQAMEKIAVENDKVALFNAKFTVLNLIGTTSRIDIDQFKIVVPLQANVSVFAECKKLNVQRKRRRE